MIRAAQQALQVTCFLKARCPAEPHQCSSLQYQGCLRFICLFQKQGMRIRRPQQLIIPEQHTALSSLELQQQIPALSPSLRKSRYVYLDYVPFAVFPGKLLTYHPNWYVTSVVNPCYSALNSTGCDHDAASNASPRKAVQAFLHVISCFIVPLKGHQASYVEIMNRQDRSVSDLAEASKITFVLTA